MIVTTVFAGCLHHIRSTGLAGSCTNPPALSYASDQDSGSGRSAVGYATVYPLSMFLRVLAAQLLILFLT